MYTSRKWLALFVLMLLAAVLAACANDEPLSLIHISDVMSVV